MRLVRGWADLPAPEVGGEEARRAADEVLSDPAYARPGPGLLTRARDWVLDRLADLVDGVVGSAGGTGLAWAVVAAVVVAAAVVAVRATRTVQRDPGTAEEAPVGQSRRPTDWVADAARLEAAGEWRAALRCRYRALVAALAARGVVEEVPGRTVGEHRADVAAAAPAALPDFDGATSLFEAAWYGGLPVGPEHGRALADLADRVLATAGARR